MALKMKSTPIIKAIFFDLDNTLYNATYAYQKGTDAIIEYLLNEKMTPLSRNVLLERYDHSRAQVKKRLPTGHTSAHNRILYFKSFLESIFNTCSPKLLLTLLSVYDQAALKETFLQEKSLLTQLKNKFDFAIVTDETTLTQMKKLSVLDPNHKLFEHVITSEEFGCEKPSKTLFLEASKKLKTPLNQCISIGDSYNKDILGAIELGAYSWWITNEHSHPLNQPLIIGQGPLIHALKWLDQL